MQETQVRSLGQEDPLEKEMAIQVFLLGEFHGQSSLVSYSPWCYKRVGLDWAINTLSTSVFLALLNYDSGLSSCSLAGMSSDPQGVQVCQFQSFMGIKTILSWRPYWTISCCLCTFGVATLLPAQLLLLNWLPAFFVACTCRLFWLFLVFFNKSWCFPHTRDCGCGSSFSPDYFGDLGGITCYLVLYVMGFGFTVWLVGDRWSFRKIQIWCCLRICTILLPYSKIGCWIWFRFLLNIVFLLS